MGDIITEELTDGSVVTINTTKYVVRDDVAWFVGVRNGEPVLYVCNMVQRTLHTGRLLDGPATPDLDNLTVWSDIDNWEDTDWADLEVTAEMADNRARGFGNSLGLPDND